MEDEEIDYDGDNYENDDVPMEEGDDMTDEIENLFLNANSSDNPIEAYQNVIELETQNTDIKKFTFRSYKEICKIYLRNNSYDLFSETFKKLMGVSSKVEENYKQSIFTDFLAIMNENPSIDYTSYFRKMLNDSEKAGMNSLNKEIEEYVKNSEKYKNHFKEEFSKQFSFDNLLIEYNSLKEKYKSKTFGNSTLFTSKEEEKACRLREYESMTITKQIPLIKKSVIQWKNENSRKFWLEWVEDYEKFTDLPIFYNEIIKVETSKIIGFNILTNLYDTKDSIQIIGFNASMYLYDILSRIFCDYNDVDLREYVVTSGIFEYILKRLETLTGEMPRKYLPDKKKKIEEKKEAETKKKEID